MYDKQSSPFNLIILLQIFRRYWDSAICAENRIHSWYDNCLLQQWPH